MRSTNLINNKSIRYHFDQNNQLIGLNYSGKEYVYARNLLGEIYGIMDLKGKSIIRYTYNVYGVPSLTLSTNLSSSETLIASDLAELNIYLYKGYIYDQETKLYYCKSRYYDPEVGRWLSIDHIAYLDVESIGGLNLYAYCGNNPVMYLGSSGKFAISILSMVIIGTVVGATLGFGFNVGGQLISNDWDFSQVDWGNAINSTIVGGALGFSLAMGVGYLGPVIAGSAGASGISALGALGISTTVSFSTGSIGYAFEEWINGRIPSFGKTLINGGMVAIEGMINFGVGGVIGSMGNIGTKGINPFRSLEWWGKFTFGQMYTQPSKNSIDLIRKNL